DVPLEVVVVNAVLAEIGHERRPLSEQRARRAHDQHQGHGSEQEGGSPGECAHDRSTQTGTGRAIDAAVRQQPSYCIAVHPAASLYASIQVFETAYGELDSASKTRTSPSLPDLALSGPRSVLWRRSDRPFGGTVAPISYTVGGNTGRPHRVSPC